MATVEDDESAATETARWSETEVHAGVDRLTLTVVGVAGIALLLRLVALGERTAHWDEARVGWWILEFMRTGAYEYRPIIHGPFYHHVNGLVFGLLGVSDGTMRLVPAVAGGLLPLSALGLRHRLRDDETLALALFLAANPILLYYSRFMRGDPIVAFCMFGAFVLFVRVIDFGSRRSLFAGVALAALALTAKENALLYPVTWAGATVLLLDHRLFRADDRDPVAIGWTYLRRTARRVRTWLPWLAVAAAEFLVIVVFFYAPRAGESGTVGLDNVANDPALLPGVLREATVGSWKSFYGLWVSGGHQDHAYLPFLVHYLETLAAGALALCLLAVLGFLVDRYGENDPSDLVSFAFYWGIASVLGYPIVTDIKAPWATIHAVIALAIPAAVGLSLVVRWGWDALADDHVGVGIAVLLVLIVAGTVAGTGLWTVYLTPQADSNQLVQYAQPGDDLRPAIDRMAAASAENEGTDVLLYGEYFVGGDENFVGGDETAERAPACAKWFNSLPLPWYFAVHGSEVGCANGEAELAESAAERPPIVVARQSEAETVRQAFPEYWTATYRLRSYGTETTVFFRPTSRSAVTHAAARHPNAPDRDPGRAAW